jgi:3-dehydroquinate dehydratase/shikimate dehydrogenase
MTASPRLCVTVTADTTAELRRRRDQVPDGDLVELRLDSVKDPDVAGALAGRTRPAVVTCRPVWEGGLFTGPEEDRRSLLEQALALGAEYVDVEWRAEFAGALIARAADRVVLSLHDFEAVPPDMADRVRAMKGAGAHIVKVAVQANRLSDCLSLLLLSRNYGANSSGIFVAMGESGLATRVLAARFGSAWSYSGTLAGIGQLSVRELLVSYRFRALTASTGIYGVVGSPVGHSVSPAMHNAAFAAAGANAVYLPLHAADADDFMTFAETMDIQGASVTIPYKIPLFERVDEAYAVARRIGAINTMRRIGSRWAGDNTDAAGFLQPLVDRGVVLKGLRASILGAGGSARAVAVALAGSGAEVTVHARDRGRAGQVAGTVSGQVGPWPPAAGCWDLLVNCTPLGMAPRPAETPIPADRLTGGLVYDLVYNPSVTRLLREAEQAGCRAIGGLEMLVAQAQEQFHWWTGERPQPGVMRTAALRRLAELEADENHVA